MFLFPGSALADRYPACKSQFSRSLQYAHHRHHCHHTGPKSSCRDEGPDQGFLDHQQRRVPGYRRYLIR